MGQMWENIGLWLDLSVNSILATSYLCTLSFLALFLHEQERITCSPGVSSPPRAVVRDRGQCGMHPPVPPGGVILLLLLLPWHLGLWALPPSPSLLPTPLNFSGRHSAQLFSLTQH